METCRHFNNRPKITTYETLLMNGIFCLPWLRLANIIKENQSVEASPICIIDEAMKAWLEHHT